MRWVLNVIAEKRNSSGGSGRRARRPRAVRRVAAAVGVDGQRHRVGRRVAVDERLLLADAARRRPGGTRGRRRRAAACRWPPVVVRAERTVETPLGRSRRRAGRRSTRRRPAPHIRRGYGAIAGEASRGWPSGPSPAVGVVGVKNAQCHSDGRASPSPGGGGVERGGDARRRGRRRARRVDRARASRGRRG